MSPRRQPPIEPSNPQQQDLPVSKAPALPQNQPNPRRQLYVFLIAADIVGLFVYFFLVPNDVWESQSTRLRSIGSLVGSVILYFGLKFALKKYFSESAFLDQVSFRVIAWLCTVALWLAILPIWSVRLAIRPPQPSVTEVQVLPQTPPTTSANSKDAQSNSAPGYRTCESSSQAIARAGAEETICALGGLLLRTYEIKVTNAPHATHLPAASIFARTLTRGVFRVQLPCTVEIYPIFPGEQVFTQQQGEAEKPRGLLPPDGVLWLMPGYYDQIKATDGKRTGMRSGLIDCGGKVEIVLQ